MSTNDTDVGNLANKLSTQLARREVDTDTWNTLQNTIFPNAHPSSILMAIDYCRARKLDILKKPVHIVPMPYKDGNDWKSRDVVMPGINEVRTTAMRTGQYAGVDRAEWGPVVEVLGKKVPEFCTYTVFRFVHGHKVPFPATVYFEEACGVTTDYKTKVKKLNAMWDRRPRGQLEKCAEAAALRKAFPEEIGNEYVPEEINTMGEGADVTARVVEPGANRTSAAADALREKLGLPDKSGEANPLSDLAQEQMRRDFELAPDTVVTEQAKTEQQPAGGMILENRRDGGRFDVESGVKALRASTSIDGLNTTWQMIQDDYEFSGRELPVDIEANFHDLKEAFEQGERR